MYGMDSVDLLLDGPGSGPSSTHSGDLFLYDDDSSSESALSCGSDHEPTSGSAGSGGGGVTVGGRRRRTKCRHQQVQQRQAANLRERRRMQSINDAFEGLRAHIPTLPYEKRLSKVDTLKLAIGYINFLSDLVAADRAAAAAAAAAAGPGAGSNGAVGHGVTGAGAAHSGCLSRQPRPDEPKKVIVRGAAGTAYPAHSLSWSSDKENKSCPRGGVMHAKLWTPEDPRAKQTAGGGPANTSSQGAWSSGAH